VVTSFARVFPHPVHNTFSVAMFHGDFVRRLALTLVVGIYSPIVQEMLFRGLVLAALLQRMSPVRAIALSSVLFGVIHLPDAESAVNACLLALLQGWLFVRFRSLWVPIVSHIVTNTTSMMSLLVFFTAHHV
jgi:membrane protease YdiL (CAAX protease family)